MKLKKITPSFIFYLTTLILIISFDQLIKQYFNTMKVIYPKEKLFTNQENVFPLINK